ncbi:MAG: sensor histidine kinase [Armatimonadota bacterium]
MATCGDRAVIARMAVERAVQLAAAESSSLLLLDEGTGAARVETAFGPGAAAFRSLDLSLDDAGPQAVAAALRAGPHDLVLCVPIAGGSVRGRLFVHARRSQPVPPRRVELVTGLLGILGEQTALALDSVIRRENTARPGYSSVDVPWGEAAHPEERRVILLVDDDRAVRESMAELLVEFGHDVVTAANGQEALELLREIPRPALILLDLTMPVMDGWEFQRRLKSMGPAGDIPVIILSALGDLECDPIAAQVTACYDKPVDPRALLGTMAAVLERERIRSEQLKLCVREAHHRIKNNLQAVTDVLSLELYAAAPTSGTEALRGCIERIQAIAIVHDLLSRDVELDHADLRELIERLAPMALAASAHSAAKVDLRIDVPHLLVPSKEATALAIVLNELISNAAKHAFPGGAGGSLRISIREGAGERLRLSVQDNGPGLAKHFEPRKHGGVGLQLVQALVESSLGGSLELRSGAGLTAIVSFDAQGMRQSAGSPEHSTPRDLPAVHGRYGSPDAWELPPDDSVDPESAPETSTELAPRRCR